MERGDFSPCGTPTGLDGRDPFDLGKLITTKHSDTGHATNTSKYFF